MQYLIEIYPDGIKEIPARNLYIRYREWCEAEGRKPMSNTRFGRKLRRVEGYRQTHHLQNKAIAVVLGQRWRVWIV